VAEVVGGLLPLAVVVAIAPVPIIAVVLMLLSPRAGGTSAGFLVGWIAGTAGLTTAVVLLTGGNDRGGGRSTTVASWAELVLGVLLLVLAGQQWRVRPTPGELLESPRWTSAVDRLTAGRAGGVGLVLSTANPKNFLVCVAAGATIAAGDLGGAQAGWSVVVFTAIAVSTVAVPVLGYAVGRRRMVGPLDSLRRWLTVHSRAVTVTLLLVLGVVLLGQGLVSLSHP
jgi:threonine/homoserine/homoserine lactone efflux protein